jgi:hypothetical protein
MPHGIAIVSGRNAVLAPEICPLCRLIKQQ